MRKDQNLGEYLQSQGVSRRGFLKFCSATASLMALPPSAVAQVAEALAIAQHQQTRRSRFEGGDSLADKHRFGARPSDPAMDLSAGGIDRP